MANNNWDSFSDDDFEDVILDLDDDLDQAAEETAANASDKWAALASAAETAARKTGRTARKVADDVEDELSAASHRRAAAAGTAAKKPARRTTRIEDDFDDLEEEEEVRRPVRSTQKQTRKPDNSSRLGSYIMIAVICLLVVALIVLALKLLLNKEPSGKNSTTTAATNEAPVETTASWEMNSPSDVLSLVNQYFAAKTMVEIQALGDLLDPVVSLDQAKVEAEAKVIESYQQICCYTTPGINTGEYGLYVSYDMKIKNISTTVPGLIFMYARPDSSGKLRLIDSDTLNDEVKKKSDPVKSILEHLAKAADCDAIKELITKTDADYWQARESDKTLDDFIKSLNGQSTEADTESTTESTAEPTTAAPTTPASDSFTTVDDTMYCIKNSVNIRLQPNTDSDVIGQLTKGNSVHVTGKGSEWYRINTKSGATGYVKKDFLSSDKP